MTVMIHADGTDCGHEGKAKATVYDDGGPACAGGIPVTHVRFNGQVLTIGQACAALKQMGDTISKALTPMVTDLARFARQVCDDISIVALAAASAVVDEEREREERR
jgi:hypothetical protein